MPMMSRALKTALAVTLAWGGASAVRAQTAEAAKDRPSAPTVVELFQSQGCSACPPAIANVNLLAGKPGVLALIFDVDYWDDLGWKDTFSSHAYTKRQWDYARGLRHSGVATPQVVINGRHDLVGGDARELGKAVATTAKPNIPVTLTVNEISVGSGIAPTGPADVWLVRYDPRIINVAIKRGENGGKTLAHKDVVKSMVRVGKWTGKPVTFPVPAGGEPGLKTAVLVQQPGGPVLGAAG